MHLELAPLEQGYNLVIINTPKGQAAMIGLTPTAPRVQQRGNNDYWKYNEEGYLIRVHKRDRKAMFTPDHGKQSTCPAPLDRFDNYRRTIIHREQQEPLVLEDQYKTLTKEQRNREPTGGLWQGETWFRILPEQKEGTTRIQQEQTQSKQSTSTPVLTRHTGKQPEKEATIPPPEKVQRTTDYWIREGWHWKRVHVIHRTEYYVPTPEDNGPDINKLLPTRYTNIHSEHNIRRIEDNWTVEPQPTRKEHWTGVQWGSAHWRRYTSNGNTSKGNDNAYTTDTTGNTGTQHYTHAIQKLVSNLRTSKRQASKSPEADIAAANRASWFHLHHRFWWQVSHTGTYSNGRTNRHGNGSHDYKQAQSVQLRADLFTSTPPWVWPDRRHSTKRQWGVPDSTTQSNSQSMWQHVSTLFTCVQLTKQPECWKVPPHTDRTNQNTQRTGTAELQPTNPHRPSTDGMGSTTLSIPDQQVSHQSWWVSSTMGTYTQRSPMWIWRNRNVHGPYTQTTTKAGAKILQRYLARKVYVNRWILRRCCKQSGTSTYSEETRRRSEVRQTNVRNSERYTVEPFTTTWIPTSLSTTTTASGRGKYRASTTGRYSRPTWSGSLVVGQNTCSCSQVYTATWWHHTSTNGWDTGKEGKNRRNKETHNRRRTNTNCTHYDETGYFANTSQQTTHYKQVTGWPNTWR